MSEEPFGYKYIVSNEEIMGYIEYFLEQSALGEQYINRYCPEYIKDHLKCLLEIQRKRCSLAKVQGQIDE